VVVVGKSDHNGEGVTYEGVHYTCTVAPVHDMSLDPLRISFGWEPSWTCDKCPDGHLHEVPGAERVATSIDEAIEKGWLTRD
jgi:hypothetical protein